MNYPNEGQQDIQAGSVSDYTRSAMQAQGLISQQANKTQQAPIRERLQEANKRADSISASVVSLIQSVMPPQLQDGLNNAMIADRPPSTLSSDMDDLCRMLAKIERQVLRLTTAIGG